jgi:hypothetical protein
VDFLETLTTTLTNNREIVSALIAFNIERLAPMLQCLQDSVPHRLSVQTFRSVLDDLIEESHPKASA